MLKTVPVLSYSLRTLTRTLLYSALYIGLFIMCLCSIEMQVEASPWVLKEGDAVLGLGVSYSYARNEFINDEKGTSQVFPLNGELRVYTFRLNTRYGLKPQLEIGFSTAIQSLSYVAHNFIHIDEDSKSNVINPSHYSAGLGDVRLNLTRQVVRGAWPLSVYVELKLPSGYALPNPNTLAQGDGQTDLKTLLQLGHLFSTGTLLGAETGGILRLNGPGHQVAYSMKLAQRIFGYFFVFCAQAGQISITTGQNTGLENQLPNDPNTPASEFSLDDTYTLPFSLTKDIHQAEVGFFLGTKRKVEYSGVLVIPWAGKNTSQLIGLFLEMNYKF